LADDVPLFMGILSDLFPGVTLPEHDYGELSTAIINSLTSAGLQPVASLVAKVIQLYETLQVQILRCVNESEYLAG
jgi:dynein heavy chain